jgi:hypothetical protein
LLAGAHKLAQCPDMSPQRDIWGTRFPVDGSFWAENEYAPASELWSTWIANLSLPSSTPSFLTPGMSVGGHVITAASQSANGDTDSRTVLDPNQRVTGGPGSTAMQMTRDPAMTGIPAILAALATGGGASPQPPSGMALFLDTFAGSVNGLGSAMLKTVEKPEEGCLTVSVLPPIKRFTWARLTIHPSSVRSRSTRRNSLQISCSPGSRQLCL